MPFEHSFSFEDSDETTISGTLHMNDVHGSGVIHREAVLILDSGKEMPIVLTHGPASSQIIYTSDRLVTPSLAKLLNLKNPAKYIGKRLKLPGQLILGAERALVFREAIDDCFRHRGVEDFLTEMGQERVLLVPVLREGIKYGLTKVLFDRFDFYLDEIVSDASHTSDKDDSVYGRGVHVGVFKDQDISDIQREKIETAIVADSVASGTVLIGLLETLIQKFPNIKHIELVAPLATIHGLARVRHKLTDGLRIRALVLETVLNALPPDYYWSAHFDLPEFHTVPHLQEEYVDWWGKDEDGNQIASTACAGFGWSEAFFNPQKQIRLINRQLSERHNLTIDQIIERH